MDNEKQIVKSLGFALELIKLQFGQIQALQLSLFALQASLESGKAPLSYKDALRQVLEENRENLRNDDEVRSLLQEHLEKVRSLSK